MIQMLIELKCGEYVRLVGATKIVGTIKYMMFQYECLFLILTVQDEIEIYYDCVNWHK